MLLRDLEYGVLTGSPGARSVESSLMMLIYLETIASVPTVVQKNGRTHEK